MITLGSACVTLCTQPPWFAMPQSVMSIPHLYYRKRTTPLILQQWSAVSQRRTTPYFWTRPWVTKYCTVIFLRLACSHVRARSVLTDACVSCCAHRSRGSHVHAPIHPRRRLWREIFAGVPGDGKPPSSSRAVVLTRHRDPRTAVACDSLGRVFNPRNASRQRTRARLTIHPRCISTHAGGAAWNLLQADHDPQRSTWPRWLPVLRFKHTHELFSRSACRRAHPSPSLKLRTLTHDTSPLLWGVLPLTHFMHPHSWPHACVEPLSANGCTHSLTA
jgi:hypothetical protein